MPSGDDTLACPQPGITVRAEREEGAQRILIINDGGVIAGAVRSQLENRGYEVLMAKDAQTALQMLRRDHPDLVLAALMLPSVDRTDVAGDIEVGRAWLPCP